MATRALITGAPLSAPISLPPILAFIAGVPVAPREAIEQLIERAIEALDDIDGDPDLEDGDSDYCTARDDIGTDQPPYGKIGFDNWQDDDGAEDGHDHEMVDEDGVGDISPVRPIYGLDQSAGPLNERQAHKAWLDEQWGARA